jgi:hypothetical protein
MIINSLWMSVADRGEAVKQLSRRWTRAGNDGGGRDLESVDGDATVRLSCPLGAAGFRVAGRQIAVPDSANGAISPGDPAAPSLESSESAEMRVPTDIPETR